MVSVGVVLLRFLYPKSLNVKNSPLYLDMEMAAAQGQGRHGQLAAAGFRWCGSACMHTGFQSMAEKEHFTEFM